MRSNEKEFLEFIQYFPRFLTVDGWSLRTGGFPAICHEALVSERNEWIDFISFVDRRPGNSFVVTAARNILWARRSPGSVTFVKGPEKGERMVIKHAKHAGFFAQQP